MPKRLALIFLSFATGAGAYVVANVTVAHAQTSFHQDIVQPLARYTQLECVPAQMDRDPDPVYKIVINLSLDMEDDESAKDLSITHVTVSGARYNRSDQYTQLSLTKTPAKREWFWSGTWNKNSSITMKGELIRTVEGKWLYLEDRLEHDRISAVTRSVCHVECQGNAPDACGE